MSKKYKIFLFFRSRLTLTLQLLNKKIKAKNMSIIARRLILAKNLNSLNFLKYSKASLANVALKANSFNGRSLILSQNNLKKFDQNYLKSNYTTDNAKIEAINNRIKTLLKGDKVVVFIKGLLLFFLKADIN